MLIRHNAIRITIKPLAHMGLETIGPRRGVRRIAYQTRLAPWDKFGPRRDHRRAAQEQSQDFQSHARRVRKPDDSGLNMLKVQDQTEPDVVVPIGWRVVVAVGHSAIGCIVVPIAAPENTTHWLHPLRTSIPDSNAGSGDSCPLAGRGPSN